MSAREPISEECLAALRTLNLAVIAPQSSAWRPAMRRQAEQLLRMVAGPVITELLDEIEELDADLDEADTALDRALCQVARLREPQQPERTPVISAVRRERLDERRWRVRWSEDGRRRTETFRTAHHARQAFEWLAKQQHRGGSW